MCAAMALAVLASSGATAVGAESYRSAALASTTGSSHPSARAGRRPVVANDEYPFGQLSVAAIGSLYYVDREHGQIDEATAVGSRIVLSSLHGAVASSQSIAGLSGLFVSGRSIWFTARNGLYEASLAGRGVRRVGSAPGAIDLDLSSDGTVYYTTTSAVFEESPPGPPRRVAGGGRIGFAEQSVAQQATAESLMPVSIANASGQGFYFVNENILYLVKSGVAYMLRQPSFNFFNGELATDAEGAVYGICGWSICRIQGRTAVELFRLPSRVNGGFLAPDALAVAPNGSFDVSYSNQASQGTRTGIVELSPSGRVIRVVESRIT
jgi:hypothetical protein